MEYLIYIAILFCISAILGMSLNLLMGYTGLLSVTHAAFYGIGAYASAVLLTQYHVNFFIGMLAGMGLAAISSFLIGLVLNRLSGDYYVLGTVGFNYIVLGIFLNWESVTRGPLGIPAIPRPNIFGLVLSSNGIFLIFCALILFLIYLVFRFITTSSFGRVLRAIREDEKAIQVFGYNALHYKLAVFVIAAAAAAVAGAMYGSFVSYIDPKAFDVMMSVSIVGIVVLGGLANLKGSLLGALFMVLIPEALRFVGVSPEIAGQARQALYGLILILLMLYRPQGLLGEYKL